MSAAAQQAFVSDAAAEQRFANPPNENRLAELESLRDFLKETLTLLDKRTQEMAAPAERLKALLLSKDKKATILEMAGAGLGPLQSTCISAVTVLTVTAAHTFGQPPQTRHCCCDCLHGCW